MAGLLVPVALAAVLVNPAQCSLVAKIVCLCVCSNPHVHPQVSGVVERMEGLLRAHTVAYDRVLEARKDPAVAAGLRTVQSYIIEKYGKVKLLQQNDTQAAGALERTS